MLFPSSPISLPDFPSRVRPCLVGILTMGTLLLGVCSKGIGSPIDSLQDQIDTYQRQGDMEAMARSYLALGEEYFSKFQHTEALQVLQAGLDAARDGQNRELEFRILDYIGLTYSWMDDYKKAIEYHWQANELESAGIREAFLADNLAHIGDVYLILGNLRQALEYQLQARELSEVIQDTMGMAASYDKIGRIYWQMGHYDQALDNLKKALSIYQDLGQSVYIYQIRATTSQVYKDLGRIDRAMEEARASLGIAEESGYQYGIANSKGMIGAILVEEERYREAESFLTEAINQFSLAGIRYELADFSTTLASMRRKNRQPQEAKQLLEDALEIANDIQSLALKARIYRELAYTHESLNQYSLAYRFLEEYELRKDSMLSSDNMKQAAYLETDYELRKREKQIEALETESSNAQSRFLMLAISGSLIMVSLILWIMYMRYRTQLRTSRLLQDKTDEIQRQNEALSASNAELRRFSDLAASDLRMPLESVREGLEQLQEEVPEVADAASMNEVRHHLGQLDALLAGISAFALIRENEQARESLDLSEVVKEAIRSLPESERKRATTIQIQQLPLIKGDRRQLVQLFQHLLSNAIRFQENEDPEVTVVGEERAGNATIRIIDKGSGVPEDEQEKVFELFYQGDNASETSGSGVGLAIARRIVRQHGGNIWIENNDQQGATFVFSIPKLES